MRVREVRVKGLFGLFDHRVPFNQDSRITIVHGPNGIGKTYLLRLIQAALTGGEELLRSAPFQVLELVFAGGGSLVVRRQAKRALVDSQVRSGDSGTTVSYKPSRGKRPVEYEIPDSARVARQYRLIPFVRRQGPGEWLDRRRGDVIGRTEVYRRYGSFEAERVERRFRQPQAVEKLWASFRVHLIEANRLYSAESQHELGRSEEPRLAPTVSKHARDLAAEIRAVLNTYAATSQALDRTFPARLLRTGTAKYDAAVIRDKLRQLEERRKELEKIGLLDPVEKEERPQTTDKRLTPDIKRTLSVVVDDTEQKLAVFDDIAKRILLFMQIVNSRFQYKRMRICKERGYVFEGPEQAALGADQLSSGEQHELVLLYQLLFAVEPGALLLIDEPELSQHVAWQRRFLGDLHGIASLRGLDAVVATHSPQIIHDRWDLAVDLRGPQK